MSAIDWEEHDTADEAPSADRLGALATYCRRHEQLEAELADLDARRKTLDAELRDVAEVQIPTLLDEVGVQQLVLDDGTRISVKEELRVSTTGKYRAPILSWLEATGHDDIVKDELTVPFGKGEDERVGQALGALEAVGVTDVSRKRAVHAQTFAALLRELREAGEDVPLDELGAFLQRRAKLERPK